jgi:hypothetical protein
MGTDRLARSAGHPQLPNRAAAERSHENTGCGQEPPKIAVENYPSVISSDPAAVTATVTNGDNTVSVIPLTH